MKPVTFAEFFHHGVLTGEPIAACGSDSVMNMDGRFSKSTCVMIARATCRKRGWVGFTLNRGTYTNSRVTRELELITP